MAKEKELYCEDQLYGGAPSALEEAEKEIENRRVYIKKVLKDAEDKAEELKKDTATEEVRLQGTKETKAPSLKPYTESVDVKDRRELGSLIGQAKKDNKLWKVERSVKEGYRYLFTTTSLNEAVEEEDSGIELDAAPVDEVMPEEVFGDEGEAVEEPSEDVAPVSAIDVFASHLDIHGNEDHSVTLCLKGDLDKEDAPRLNMIDLTDDEYEILKSAFDSEDAKEEEPKEEPEEKKEEVVDESYLKEEQNTYSEFIKVVEEDCERTGETVVANILRRLDTMIKNGAEFIADHKPLLKMVAWCCKYLYGQDIKMESLEEASTAEKKAFKNGGEDADDLVLGRAIGRIKDPETRHIAARAAKIGRKDVVRQIVGDRKERQADDELQKKFTSMQKAGMTGPDDELNLGESLLVEEDSTVNDNLEIKLDDLQYFKPCAGARETWNVILENNKLEELAKALSDFAKDGKMTTTDLNDLLWFEKDWVYDTLGINPLVKHGDDVIDVETEVE